MFYCRIGDELRLHIKLTPRASKDEIKAVETIAEKEFLAVRVRALPEKGEANNSLLKILAKELDLPITSIKLLTGASSRLKQVSIGIANEDVVNKLHDWQKKTR